MEQEDYLKRQIDQLGRVLGKILADLIGLRSHGQASNGIEAADQALKNELNLNINELTSIPNAKFISTLLEGRKLSHANFEQLADILFLLAEEPDHGDTVSGKKKELYERSFILYEHLDRTSLTYSFDRHCKIEKIKSSIWSIAKEKSSE